LWARIFSAAMVGSPYRVTCTWPIINGSSASAVKPPASRTIFAAKETAATTDGSSTAMGTR
jgi:hypothetical protein